MSGRRVDVSVVGSDVDDFCDEHVVSAKSLNAFDATFDAEWGFCDGGGRNDCCLSRSEPHLLELIIILSTDNIAYCLTVIIENKTVFRLFLYVKIISFLYFIGWAKHKYVVSPKSVIANRLKAIKRA